MKSSFHRKVSPLERVFVLLHDMDKPFSNQVVIEGKGTLDKGLLEKAVEAACEANPGSRLIYRGCSGWASWVDSGLPAPVREVDGSDWDAFGPDGALFLCEPLPFRSTHSCEVVLLNGNPTRIVFRTLHATMDGRGTLIWIENIFRALRGEPLTRASSTITDSDLIYRMDKPKKWERKLRTCLAPTGDWDGGNHGNTWKRICLSGNYFNILPQTAIAIANETRKHGPCDVCFNVPVDLRRWMPHINTTVNLSRRIVLSVPEDATTESIQKQLIVKLKHLSTEPRFMNLIGFIPLGILSYCFSQIRKKCLKTGRYYSTGSISYLGQLPVSEFQGGGFKAGTIFLVPPGTEGKPMFMSLTGSEHSLEIVVSMPRALASQGRLDQFVSNVAQALTP